MVSANGTEVVLRWPFWFKAQDLRCSRAQASFVSKCQLRRYLFARTGCSTWLAHFVGSVSGRFLPASGHPRGEHRKFPTQFSKQQAESRNLRTDGLFGGVRWNRCRSSLEYTEEGDAACSRTTPCAPVGAVPQTDRACRKMHLCLGRKEED